MKRGRMRAAHAPGLLSRWVEALRGRRQKLLRPSEEHPLVLLSYPPGAEEAATEMEIAYTHTFGGLRAETRALYEPVLQGMPALVVVQLRFRNPCGCLGHHHPPGTESRAARRLAAELGSPVGEIDLAYEEIRRWQPQPLAALAVNLHEPHLAAPRFRVALLTVMLHEFHHLVSPESSEQEVRGRSNRFYELALAEVVADESGSAYGIASPSPLP